jgi:hypothetical protein
MLITAISDVFRSRTGTPLVSVIHGKLYAQIPNSV